MIQVNELRVGNWIASGKSFTNTSTIGKVLEIGNVEREFEQIYCECEESFEWFFKDNYCGIPLTPEILEKAGFKMSITKTCYGIITPETRISWFSDGRMKIETTDLPIKVQYVHQLQNVTYYLTNNELNIQL